MIAPTVKYTHDSVCEHSLSKPNMIGYCSLFIVTLLVTKAWRLTACDFTVQAGKIIFMRPCDWRIRIARYGVIAWHLKWCHFSIFTLGVRSNYKLLLGKHL